MDFKRQPQLHNGWPRAEFNLEHTGASDSGVLGWGTVTVASSHLFQKVADGVWIIRTPDLDVHREDYNGLDVRPLTRNVAFPNDIVA
jgi:hypothetical protein